MSTVATRKTKQLNQPQKPERTKASCTEPKKISNQIIRIICNRVDQAEENFQPEPIHQATSLHRWVASLSLVHLYQYMNLRSRRTLKCLKSFILSIGTLDLDFLFFSWELKVTQRLSDQCSSVGKALKVIYMPVIFMQEILSKICQGYYKCIIKCSSIWILNIWVNTRLYSL